MLSLMLEHGVGRAFKHGDFDFAPAQQRLIEGLCRRRVGGAVVCPGESPVRVLGNGKHESLPVFSSNGRSIITPVGRQRKLQLTRSRAIALNLATETQRHRGQGEKPPGRPPARQYRRPRKRIRPQDYPSLGPLPPTRGEGELEQAGFHSTEHTLAPIDAFRSNSRSILCLSLLVEKGFGVGGVRVLHQALQPSFL